VFSGVDGSVLYDFVGDPSTEPDLATDLFGRKVSGAGDVNGDGFDDLIVGAPRDDNNGTESGNARVFSGADGSLLYDIDGDSAGDGFGRPVCGAGDVNGDGFDDFMVGASGDDNNGLESGSVRVFSGVDGSVLYTFDGDPSSDPFGFSDNFGGSLSGAGDVNGDGLADLIVGASGDDNNGTNTGSVRVFSGADGSVLYNFDGDASAGFFGDQFGQSVSGAGDVNGDGVADFFVGTERGGANNGGYARLFVSQVSDPIILGDCDQSGFVDFEDIPAFVELLITESYLEEADVYVDGVVDFLDIPPFIEILIGL